MADLGTIGTHYSLGVAAAGSAPPSGAAPCKYVGAASFVPIPLYRTTTAPSEWGALDRTGTLSGFVTEGGTPVNRCLVSCYWRDNGNLVARVLSDSAGAFSFLYLDKSVPGYYIVAQDPPGGTQYNAKVFDYLTPV